MSNINYESELIKKLNLIEKKFSVELLVYRDVYIWPIVKVKLYFEILTNHNKSANSESQQSILKKLLLYISSGLKLLLTDSKNFDFLKKCDVVFCADPFNRRVSVEKKRYEIYIDPIRDSLKSLQKTSLVLERNTPGDYQIPRYSSSFPQFILQIIYMPMFLFRINLEDHVVNLLVEIENELINDGYIANSIKSSKIKRFLKIFNMHRKLYLFIYGIAKPKLLILTEWYSIVSMAATIAAKDLGITTIEVQHGVQTDAHIAYGHWTKNPLKAKNPFPDFFWVWTEDDIRNIEITFEKFSSKGFLGGNPFISNFINANLVLDGELELEPMLKYKNKICLVTLQPNYELNDLILEYIEIIKSEYVFLFRKHPLMSESNARYFQKIKERFPSLTFDIEVSSKIPLLILLKHADLHLTYNSSTVIEAELLSVPSIVFDQDIGKSLYKAQIERGSCQVYSGKLINFQSQYEKADGNHVDSIKSFF